MKYWICENWILTIAIGMLLWLGITTFIFIQSLCYVRSLYVQRIHISLIGTNTSQGSFVSEAVKITKILSSIVGVAEVLILVIILIV